MSKVHWVKPEKVCEITYLTWADDGLLRHTVFVGLREDKPPTVPQEASWREDNRRMSNGEQVARLAGWRWHASRALILLATGSGRKAA
jgi:ATP-dependent DNA ligase